MLMDLLVALVMTFVIGPIRAEVGDALAAAAVPVRAVSEVTACLEREGPRIAERAWADPWWGVSVAASVTFGLIEPSRALVDVAPGCVPLIDRAIGASGDGEV